MRCPCCSSGRSAPCGRRRRSSRRIRICSACCCSPSAAWRRACRTRADARGRRSECDSGAVVHEFDRACWDRHWDEAHALAGVPAGVALDAGCGTGADAVWLASRGWRVTGADLAAAALHRAAAAAAAAGVADHVDWVQADLTRWRPAHRFDLVLTCYAHPAMPPLAFTDRIASWVASRGTLLVVAHGHGSSTRHGGEAPAATMLTADAVAARLSPADWR